MTRNPAPVTPPVVLTIAGSDSGGGAGIQADLKTIEAGGGFGTSAITAVTAQNTQGVDQSYVLPLEQIRAQCDAVFDDFNVAALKTGMLATADVVELATEQVRGAETPAVVDPVMVAATGDRLLNSEAEAAYEELIAEASLVTPNADEAEVLTGITVTDRESAREAGERLVSWGVDGALVKGGHVPGENIADVLVTEDAVETVRHPRIDTEANHGSGCTLSAAIATRLAYGDDLSAAVQTSIDLLARAVRYNLNVGEGPGAVHHTVAARDRAEREPTAEQVSSVVETFVDRDVSRLVSEVGMNVAGATPYAEVPAECAAVEGRIARTFSGVEPTGGVRFGASTYVAGALLAVREFDADQRFAVNCRLDDDVELAVESLDWHLAEHDSSADGDVPERESLESTLGDDFENDQPLALAYRASVGREAQLLLFAPTAGSLVERTQLLLDLLE